MERDSRGSILDAIPAVAGGQAERIGKLVSVDISHARQRLYPLCAFSLQKGLDKQKEHQEADERCQHKQNFPGQLFPLLFVG